MNYTQLSLEQAPDIWSPLRFFISAPLFAIAAVVLLMFTGPDVFQNRWLPQTLGITHLLTLGFISMVMMGALFQLLPVLAGSAIYRSKYSSKAIHRLMVVGVVLFCSGLYLSNSQIIKFSLFFLLPAIFIFLVLVSIALYKASSKFASAKGMRFSVAALWLAFMIGGLLAAGSAWSEVPLLREFTNLHLVWAALGWVMTMIVAISFQVIPMFQVTSEYSEYFKRWFFIVLFACILLLSIEPFIGFFSEKLFTVSLYLLISILLVLFSVISIKLLLQRKKRLADGSLYYWLTGLGSLILSVLAFNVEMLFSYNLHVFVGFVFFVGFVMSVVNGMLFKIVPFLVWLHLNKKLAFSDKGLSSVPTMNEVISRKKMYRQYLLHACALLLTALSFFLPAYFFYIAMIVWLVNFSLLYIYLLQAVRMYYSCLK